MSQQEQQEQEQHNNHCTVAFLGATAVIDPAAWNNTNDDPRSLVPGVDTMVGRMLFHLHPRESNPADVGAHDEHTHFSDVVARGLGPLRFALLSGLRTEDDKTWPLVGPRRIVTRCFFCQSATANNNSSRHQLLLRHRFSVVLPPRHRSFMPGTVRGIGLCDAAVLVVPAPKDLFDRAFSSATSSIKDQLVTYAAFTQQFQHQCVVVAVDQMDQVNFAQDRFDAVVREVSTFMEQVGFPSVSSAAFAEAVVFVPTCSSAKDEADSNLIRPSASTAEKKMPWWTSQQSLLQVLDSHPALPRIVALNKQRAVQLPFRMSCFDLMRIPGIGTVATGRVLSGSVECDKRPLPIMWAEPCVKQAAEVVVVYAAQERLRRNFANPIYSFEQFNVAHKTAWPGELLGVSMSQTGLKQLEENQVTLLSNHNSKLGATGLHNYVYSTRIEYFVATIVLLPCMTKDNKAAREAGGVSGGGIAVGRQRFTVDTGFSRGLCFVSFVFDSDNNDENGNEGNEGRAQLVPIGVQTTVRIAPDLKQGGASLLLEDSHPCLNRFVIRHGDFVIGFGVAKTVVRPANFIWARSRRPVFLIAEKSQNDKIRAALGIWNVRVNVLLFIGRS